MPFPDILLIDWYQLSETSLNNVTELVGENSTQAVTIIAETAEGPQIFTTFNMGEKLSSAIGKEQFCDSEKTISANGKILGAKN